MWDDEDYDWDYWHRSGEANDLINKVLLRGQCALDDYVWRYMRKGLDGQTLDAMTVAEEAARKLCRHREQFSRGCPAIQGAVEDGWCEGCFIAGQIAFASGLLGVVWREQWQKDGCS